MASFATFGRLSARLAGRKLAQDAVSRAGLRTSATAMAAQNFTMPALSPTMMEGNIAAWRVKEGEKFSAGDVLLEIETDKATMDVEAQDEGVLMKIMQGDGTKGVKVGARIAVIAEEGDDVASLEIPEDESASSSSGSSSSRKDTGEKSATPPPLSAEQEAQREPAAVPTKKKQQQRNNYPHLPSVAHLLREKGIDDKTAAEITPTGPNGRLLKGDVLAHLGAIRASTPAEIEARWQKLSHLDLSNVKVAAAAAPPAKPKAATAADDDAAPQPLVVALSVSLAAAAETQRRIESSIGVVLPLSTFVARAADLANDDLPVSSSTRAAPSAGELFNQVLGLHGGGVGTAAAARSRGSYLPLISAAVPPGPLAASLSGSARRKKKVDIIDLLASSGSGAAAKKPTRTTAAPLPRVSAGISTFSLVVPPTEEKRAKLFLERVKLVLENEPGRLVL